MNKTKEGDDSSLIPRLFAQEDIQVLQKLKGLSEESTKQLGHVTDIARSAASIASSAATIRKSDNDVIIMSQAIAAKKEMFHEFLTATFAGRDKAIDALIDQIENGVNRNDTEALLKAMDGLTKIVSSSPWPDFNSLNKMIDSGVEIVLE